MRFALVEGQRTPPTPGLEGICPVCESPVIPKCGNERVHHWSHRAMRNCDSWWEPETEWHRSWKDKFPQSWQEVIKFDANGEKHIADVCCPSGAVVEFQHSHLRPEERAARERFYGNMVWVVDGLRLTRDLPRFVTGHEELRLGPFEGVYLASFPDDVLPAKWTDCPVPVLFDFAPHDKPAEELEPIVRPLCCLLPGRVYSKAVFIKLSREDFVSWASEKPEPIPARYILAAVHKSITEAMEREQRDRAQYKRRMAQWKARRYPSPRRRNPRF